MEQQLLTPTQIGQALNLTSSGVRRRLRAGQIPGVRWGKNGWRIPQGAFDSFIKQLEMDALAALKIEQNGGD